ncbi:MAG: endonuclease/exonuclease/phosphatase family protein [Candidatus Omnitrophica bacterium]|nr:endonuclease/exonuclease/phosphatase family protein [Candidatus Omnitrophota bacterium]
MKKTHHSIKMFKSWYSFIFKFLGVFVFCMVLFFIFRPEGELIFSQGVLHHQDAENLRVKVLTWNVLRGNDEFFNVNSWYKRKRAFQTILEQRDYDIICFQEALFTQISFFQEVLAGYDYIGVGRGDGLSKGEHTPIFYRRDRFDLVDSKTFWLSPTPDVPSRGWGEFVPRICTWVELKDKASQQHFRVYNTHLQLSPYAQFSAARMLAQRLRVSKIPAVLLGDLNMPAQWPAFRSLKDAGLQSVDTKGALTYHIYGKGIRCLDHILYSKNWYVLNGGLIKQKVDDRYPSDHWGLWAELTLKKYHPSLLFLLKFHRGF